MFKIVNESILDQKVDAIVNPANTHLRHGGGLARTIDRAARRDWHGSLDSLYALLDNPGDLTAKERHHVGQVADWLDDHDEAPLIPTGGAYVTRAGRLPFQAVIHTVGPIWAGGSFYERELLRSAYVSAIALAIHEGYASIAVPAISAGIFGVPLRVVAEAACSAARQYGHLIDITICLTSDEDVALFEEYR